MNNNDILRRLRYALDIKNATMIEVFKAVSETVTEADIIRLLKKEDDDDCLICSNEVMCSFLNGLIIYKRGPSDKKPDTNKNHLTNNMVLKKIRIALEIKEEEMLDILKLGNLNISKYELSALFRKEGHKNYRECGDQFLRYFLKGLAEKRRATS